MISFHKILLQYLQSDSKIEKYREIIHEIEDSYYYSEERKNNRRQITTVRHVRNFQTITICRNIIVRSTTYFSGHIYNSKLS
jgi:hypothetical protein